MRELTIYTDGSCLGNPGPGGWAWACELGWGSNGAPKTTNNAMELLAIKEALQAARRAGFEHVHLWTDSKYAIDSMTKWVHGWRKRGWTNAQGNPVANREVIEEILEVQGLIRVSYNWVRGHAGHHWNERVDDLARRQATAWRAGTGREAGPGIVLPE
jgi:ribonuclease HI